METMTADEVRQLLAHARLGHLGLADGGRAYVIPLFYAFEGGTVFFHSHPGLKDAYREVTEEACLVVASVASEDVWASVQAFGPVERVERPEERRRAMDALLRVALPPEYGVSSLGEPIRSERDLVLWKLTPLRIEGRKSVRPEAEAVETA